MHPGVLGERESCMLLVVSVLSSAVTVTFALQSLHMNVFMTSLMGVKNLTIWRNMHSPQAL